MRATNFHQLPRFAPAPRHGYEALEPDHNADGVAAYEAFKSDVLPTLAEIHGGELAVDDHEHTRAWLLFLRGWNASYLHWLPIRHAEENGRCP